MLQNLHLKGRSPVDTNNISLFDFCTDCACILVIVIEYFKGNVMKVRIYEKNYYYILVG